MKAILKFGLSLMLVSICFSVFAQKNVPLKKVITNRVDSIVQIPYFTFVANQVLPVRGVSRYLTGEYTLKVTKDTVAAYLPFFGRAYTAPLNASEAGIEFVSKDFEYQKKVTKRGNYEIHIVPRDIRNSYQFFLTIFKNGEATLSVSSIQRESISFYGTVK